MAKVTLFQMRNREKGQIQESFSAFGLVKETNTSCFGWALIPNHFHLVLKTGDVPIATVMRRLLTGIWGKFICEAGRENSTRERLQN